MYAEKRPGVVDRGSRSPWQSHRSWLGLIHSVVTRHPFSPGIRKPRGRDRPGADCPRFVAFLPSSGGGTGVGGGTQNRSLRGPFCKSCPSSQVDSNPQSIMISDRTCRPCLSYLSLLFLEYLNMNVPTRVDGIWSKSI